MKRVLLACLVVALVIFGVTGCKKDSDEEGILEGIWDIDSTVDVPGGVRNLGDGTIELSFIGEADFMGIVIEAYQGSGTVGGEDYLVIAAYYPNFPDDNVEINLSQVDDTDPDSIDLVGDLGGTGISGDYSGAGRYDGGDKDIGSGTFTAIQN